MLRLGLVVSLLALSCPVGALAAGRGGEGETPLLADYVDGTTYTIQHAGAPLTLSIRKILADLPKYRWDYVVVEGNLTTVQVVDLKITFCHYPLGRPGDARMLTESINVLQVHLDHEADNFGDCLGLAEDAREPGIEEPIGQPIRAPSEQPGDTEHEAREREERDREDREARNHEEQDREDREARSDRSDRADREGRDEREGREERDNRD